MSYTVTELTYPSSDGKNTIYAKMYIPEGRILGAVQLSHGMVDHVERYEELAIRLAEAGFVFAGNDHLGHGKSVRSEEDFGYFTEKDPITCILRDIHTLNRIIRDRFGVKPYLFGHSMGSFISRLFAERHSASIQGHIIHGTGGPMGAILPIGKGIVKLISLFKGERYRSKFVKNMSFMGYNSRFPKEEGENAWLTRDIERVADRPNDPRTSFTFTLEGYRTLFELVGESNKKSWFTSYPTSLRTLIVSGSDDPVGKYGEGPTYVYKHLLLAGVTDVSLEIFEGARHELFNETNREEYYAFLIKWLLGEK